MVLLSLPIKNVPFLGGSEFLFPAYLGVFLREFGLTIDSIRGLSLVGMIIDSRHTFCAEARIVLVDQ